MTNDTPGPAPLLWTARQTAKAMAVCEKTLWNLVHAGRLRAVRIGPRGLRYDPVDVAAFIAAAKTGGQS